MQLTRTTSVNTAAGVRVAQAELKSKEQCMAESGELLGLVNNFTGRYAREFEGQNASIATAMDLPQSALDLLGRIDRFLRECGHHLDEFEKKMWRLNQKGLREKVGMLSRPSGYQLPPLMWPQLPNLNFPRIAI